jgi:hypothetical protein
MLTLLFLGPGSGGGDRCERWRVEPRLGGEHPRGGMGPRGNEERL